MTDVARTLRAVAEVIVPGEDAGDPTEGAAEIAAETFIEHYLEFVREGLATELCGVLDARAGSTFAELPLSRRAEVLEALVDGDEQTRSLADLLTALVTAAVYGEWSGQDASGALMRPPLGWELTGYPGPLRARAGLLRGH